jgi:hypothetical protein
MVSRSSVGARVFRITFDGLFLLEICEWIVAFKNDAVPINVNFRRFDTCSLELAVAAWARSGSPKLIVEIVDFRGSKPEAFTAHGVSTAAKNATQVATN